MNIEVKAGNDGYEVILTKVFSGVTIKTEEGKELNICLRDFGFDMNINGGKWFHVNDDSDFSQQDEIFKIPPITMNMLNGKEPLIPSPGKGKAIQIIDSTHYKIIDVNI